MRDLHGLRRSGGSGRQLLQHDVGFLGLDRVDRPARAQCIDGDDLDAPLPEQRFRDVERCSEHHDSGADHAQHCLGVARPPVEVGARGGLVQHRDACAAHPHALTDRGDVDRKSGQDRDRVARYDPVRGQASCHAPRLRMDLHPGLPTRRVRIAGDQPRVLLRPVVYISSVNLLTKHSLLRYGRVLPRRNPGPTTQRDLESGNRGPPPGNVIESQGKRHRIA